MSYSPDSPKSPGPFNWLEDFEHHPPLLLNVWLSGTKDGLVTLHAGKLKPASSLGGFWQRLGPADEIKKAWDECTTTVCNDLRGHGVSVGDGWEDSRAKRVLEGMDKDGPQLTCRDINELSAKAMEATCWLLTSQEAAQLTTAEARRYILDHYGTKVAAELKAFYS